MLCCNDNGESSSSSPTKYTPITATRTSNDFFQPIYKESNFPGLIREASTDKPPADCILVKTGGNALQAIPRQEALQDNNNMVAVSVPENVKPGQEILVLAPDGSGACKRVTVPEGALPGHTFLVSFDQQQQQQGTETPVVVVMGIPVEQDLLLSSNENTEDVEKVTTAATNAASAFMNTNSNVPVIKGTHVHQDSHSSAMNQEQQQQQQQPFDAPNSNSQTSTQQQQQQQQQQESGRILVKVPPGVNPGDTIRVKIPDGRIVEATVPPGETSQFYLKVPSKNQNHWHDNPIAYGAPMLAGPLLM